MHLTSLDDDDDVRSHFSTLARCNENAIASAAGEKASGKCAPPSKWVGENVKDWRLLTLSHQYTRKRSTRMNKDRSFSIIYEILGSIRDEPTYLCDYGRGSASRTKGLVPLCDRHDRTHRFPFCSQPSDALVGSQSCKVVCFHSTAFRALHSCFTPFEVAEENPMSV